jgi:hypothetical protein
VAAVEQRIGRDGLSLREEGLGPLPRGEVRSGSGFTYVAEASGNMKPSFAQQTVKPYMGISSYGEFDVGSL